MGKNVKKIGVFKSLANKISKFIVGDSVADIEKAKKAVRESSRNQLESGIHRILNMLNKLDLMNKKNKNTMILNRKVFHGITILSDGGALIEKHTPIGKQKIRMTSVILKVFKNHLDISTYSEKVKDDYDKFINDMLAN